MTSPSRQMLIRCWRDPLLQFERQQNSDRRIDEEAQRPSHVLAKTTRLREQRLARDAAEAEAEKHEKPKGRRPK